MDKITTIDVQNISDKIYLIRGKQVMLDGDLAELYGVETKRINEAVKNNPNKFPADFYFELKDNEFESLRSKFSTTNLKSNISASRFTKTRTNPKVFTEQGIYMLATILKSKTATNATVAIMRTFVNMRSFLTHNASIFQRFDAIETKQLQYQLQTDNKFNKIFKAIESKEVKPTEGIFYNGQIFDAWQFVSGIIKEAKQSIILIDNYIDESILTILSKRNKTVYHIGASLKDLGKKWFAFSKIEIKCLSSILINRLPMFKNCQKGDLTNAEWLADRVVNIPSSVI